jgi:hypothetical protein
MIIANEKMTETEKIIAARKILELIKAKKDD